MAALGLLLLLLLAVVGAANAAAPGGRMSIISYNEEHAARGLERTEPEARTLYELWLAEHGRAYNALGERDRRFRVFWDNLRFVDAHNERAAEHGFRLGMNQFADLTNDEFRAAYLGARIPASRRRGTAVGERYRHGGGAEELPESVDWREKGAVAPVKNQGQCGEEPGPFSFGLLTCVDRLVLSNRTDAVPQFVDANFGCEVLNGPVLH
jgi:hypothetical protein